MKFIKQLPKYLRGEIVKHLDVETLVNLGWLNIIQLVSFGKNQNIAVGQIMKNLSIVDIINTKCKQPRAFGMWEENQYDINFNVYLSNGDSMALKIEFLDCLKIYKQEDPFGPAKKRFNFNLVDLSNSNRFLIQYLAFDSIHIQNSRKIFYLLSESKVNDFICMKFLNIGSICDERLAQKNLMTRLCARMMARI